MSAACQLVRQLDAVVAQCLVVIELTALDGRSRVDAPVKALLQR